MEGLAVPDASFPWLEITREVRRLLDLREPDAAVRNGLAAYELALKYLGAHHPNVALSAWNLGIAFQCAEELAEAEEWQIRTLALREEILGPNHPDVIESLFQVSGLYLRRGDIEKAGGPLYRRAGVLTKAESEDSAKPLASAVSFWNEAVETKTVRWYCSDFYDPDTPGAYDRWCKQHQGYRDCKYVHRCWKALAALDTWLASGSAEERSFGARRYFTTGHPIRTGADDYVIDRDKVLGFAAMLSRQINDGARLQRYRETASHYPSIDGI